MGREVASTRSHALSSVTPSARSDRPLRARRGAHGESARAARAASRPRSIAQDRRRSAAESPGRLKMVRCVQMRASPRRELVLRRAQPHMQLRRARPRTVALEPRRRRRRQTLREELKRDGLACCARSPSSFQLCAHASTPTCRATCHHSVSCARGVDGGPCGAAACGSPSRSSPTRHLRQSDEAVVSGDAPRHPHSQEKAAMRRLCRSRVHAPLVGDEARRGRRGRNDTRDS